MLKWPTDIYLSLSSYNITKLTMDRNYFKHLNISAIGHHLPNLAYLDVSFNNVKVITTGRLPNMIELELHHNYIDVDGMFYSNGYCNFPNLQIINLGSNITVNIPINASDATTLTNVSVGLHSLSDGK
jgi:Leucine-rich repeat (LRR) protein